MRAITIAKCRKTLLHGGNPPRCSCSSPPFRKFMLGALTILLVFQIIGETISRWLGLPVFLAGTEATAVRAAYKFIEATMFYKSRRVGLVPSLLKLSARSRSFARTRTQALPVNFGVGVCPFRGSPIQLSTGTIPSRS